MGSVSVLIKIILLTHVAKKTEAPYWVYTVDF